MRLWVIYFGPNYPGFTEESTEWLNKSKCRWHRASSRNSGQFVQKGEKKWKSLHFLLLYLVIEVKNTPLIWPLSATLWAHRLQPTGLCRGCSQTAPTPPHTALSRAGVRTAEAWRGGVPMARSGWQTLALLSVTQCLVRKCIDNKAIIYWANFLCSRQRLNLHQVLIFIWVNWGTEKLYNFPIITQLVREITRLWTQKVVSRVPALK